MWRAENVVNSISKTVDVIWENIPDDIAVDVFVYARDKSLECRNDKQLDGEICSRHIIVNMMSYDVHTVKQMQDTRYDTHENW